MKAFIPLIAVLSLVGADPVLRAKWSSFKADHGKSYSSADESLRLKTFAANLRHIDEHNAKFAKGQVSYQLGTTPLTDMTREEIRSKMLGAVVNRRARQSLNATSPAVMPSAPGSCDWRSITTSVKNQETCGSCYTFSSTGVLEAYLKKQYTQDFDLSEQQLVDCTFESLEWGLNYGCGGGDPGMTISHALKNGVAQENEYPYRNTKASCRSKQGSMDFSHLQLMKVDMEDENALASTLAQYGPIAITLNGENPDFGNYVGGIYDNSECPEEINHAVLLVGYGSKDGQDFWVIKNSWGPRWGEKGFMRMAKGVNRCGIVSQDSYFVA